jgi:hypothetical protein
LAVNRTKNKFPDDFYFQINENEFWLELCHMHLWKKVYLVLFALR